ncbi:hypothetical protein WPS_02580 [Vulcanimicrobium alpinum]|uniref:Uncharacterized protein n=1 Tax=Vulcanimicrobium alpinum TaxID=3016050 RepID=A0AAN1XSC6_UNVUL|nr:hypothetical protein [Vulcanimicrobium alpinum]BDE04982.1 hypothetical protein WPS_02580 [Vulcanimicrobium alpinum]
MEAGSGPSWRTLLLQFIAPSAIATLISSALAIYNLRIAEIDKQRDYETTFTKVLTDTVLPKSNVFKAQSTLEDEQEMSAYLFALDGLAQTETQHRTVLLLAARLLNANPNREDTGSPAARFLDVAIGDIQDELSRGRNADLNGRLNAMVTSPTFVDLVAAGYATQYYNDAQKQTSFARPTRLGDQDIAHEAKARLLDAVGVRTSEGWIHVASWVTTYRVKVGDQCQPFGEAQSALDRGQLPPLERSLAEYVVPLPDALWIASFGASAARSTSPPCGGTAAPARAAGDGTSPVPASSPARIPPALRPLRPRLLRDEAPRTHVAADGTFMRGTLGRVVGDVLPTDCLQLIALRPVLVFVPDWQIDKKGDGRHAGLLHLWAHVRKGAAGCPE